METVYVTATIRSSQHTPWNQGRMDYEIENLNALLIREVATQRTTMEKWIGYEEEGSLIPRCRGTPNKIEGSELRDTEITTENNAIRVLAYIGHK